MIKGTVQLFVVVLFPFFSGAQIINIDREFSDDSLHRRWAYAASVSLSTDKQAQNVLDFASQLEVDRFLGKRYVMIGMVKNDAIFLGRQAIQNEGLVHIRLRDNDSRKYSVESYLQYQWNGGLGLEYRYLGGANFRMKFFEKRKADLYAALGLFREWERWNWNGVKAALVPDPALVRKREMFRVNQYLKYSVKLTDQLDISTVSYLQFPTVGRFLQPRWFFDLNAYVAAGKHLRFMMHWDHMFDNRRVVPIDQYYYGFSTGIQYEW